MCAILFVVGALEKIRKPSWTQATKEPFSSVHRVMYSCSTRMLHFFSLLVKHCALHALPLSCHAWELSRNISQGSAKEISTKEFPLTGEAQYWWAILDQGCSEVAQDQKTRVFNKARDGTADDHVPGLSSASALRAYLGV